MENNNGFIEDGQLPFGWKEVLQSFEVGQTKRYRINPGMVSTIRGHIMRFQRTVGSKFTSRCDECYIYITRIE